MMSCAGSCVQPLEGFSLDQISRELFKCLHNDQLIKARILMKSLNSEDRKRAVSQTFDGSAPLFLACQRGRLHFVNFFLDACGANIEQRGVYEVAEERTRHEVTPLWCASVSNHVEILKSLLKHGADVNAVSDTQSTPVRSACYMTNVEVVKLLVENGADIHKANVNGGTCLINSVQSVELCRILIDKKADVNVQDHSGNTALHYAIREERMDTVRLLIKHNSDVCIKNDNGDNAFRTASLRGYPHILKFLFQHAKPSIQCQIESHELMGTNFVDEKNDIPMAMQEWRTALQLRETNDLMLTPNDIKEPQAAYCNYSEAITLEQLAEIEGQPNLLYMHSLIIRERLLGPTHKDTVFGLMYRGALYADSRCYQRCVDLWKYAFYLQHKKEKPFHHETIYTLQALCKLFFEIDEEHSSGHSEEKVRYEDVIGVFDVICSEVTGCKDQAQPVKDPHTTVLLLLHFINLLHRVASLPEQSLEFRRKIHQVIRKKPAASIPNGHSLLHLAIDPKTSYIAGEFYSKFPNPHVIKLLLNCGADVNFKDSAGNTPLHCCSELAAKSGSDAAVEKVHIEKLAFILLEHGAHYDARNKRGVTAGKALRNVSNKIRVMEHVNLKCLAARTVQSQGVPYEGEVPESLVGFIQLH